MADHKKAKLTENIKNNMKKTTSRGSTYLNTYETNESPQRIVTIRNVKVELPVITPKNKPNNLLSKYNSLSLKVGNTTSGEFLKSKDEIIRSIGKQFGIKSPSHKRRSTLNFMKSYDFYYLK
jgi:hypothetical protein